MPRPVAPPLAGAWRYNVQMRTAFLLALLLASAPVRAEEKGSAGHEAHEKQEGHEKHEAREAEGPPPARPGEGLAGDVSGEMKPPPGSPEDQALWSECLDLSHRITLSRTLATRLQWEARNEKVDEKLAQHAKRSGGAAAKEAAELQKAYLEALALNYLTLTRRWPVDPTRGCQYPMLYLGSAMREGKPELLGPARAEARTCTGKARPAIEVMEGSNADLQRLSAEAARVLGVAAR